MLGRSPPENTGTSYGSKRWYRDPRGAGRGRRHRQQSGETGANVNHGKALAVLLVNKEMSLLFTRAAKLAGLGHRTLYELRHCGASDDAPMGVTWQVIKERGRWAADRSVARYPKKGMLRQSWSNTPDDVRNFCALCDEVLLDVLSDPGNCPSLP